MKRDRTLLQLCEMGETDLVSYYLFLASTVLLSSHVGTPFASHVIVIVVIVGMIVLAVMMVGFVDQQIDWFSYDCAKEKVRLQMLALTQQHKSWNCKFVHEKYLHMLTFVFSVQ